MKWVGRAVDCAGSAIFAYYAYAYGVQWLAGNHDLYMAMAGCGAGAIFFAREVVIS